MRIFPERMTARLDQGTHPWGNLDYYLIQLILRFSCFYVFIFTCFLFVFFAVTVCECHIEIKGYLLILHGSLDPFESAP